MVKQWDIRVNEAGIITQYRVFFFVLYTVEINKMKQRWESKGL